VFRELGSGLKRNLSMTIAVVVTMWVSLTLFGIGLLAAEQVDLMKGRWYDQIEISVFLCVPNSSSPNCEKGVDATQAQKDAIRTTLEANSEVASVYYESKEEAFKDFTELYKDSPVMATMKVEDMNDSFRVKLKNPQEYMSVTTEVGGMKGVEAVQDLHKVLDPLFTWLNGAQVGTIGASALLLLAAVLQIANTIRMSAFSRRREIGIMRLVGASNWYIMLPFLLEALVAALLGAALACGSLAAFEKFIILDQAKPSITSMGWIGWGEVQWAMLWIVVTGALLAIIPTIVATRRFLRV
jgi:cell division transport system permease protein